MALRETELASQSLGEHHAGFRLVGGDRCGNHECTFRTVCTLVKRQVQTVHFPEKLARLMDHHRLSNKALGERLGIAHTTIGRWLSGESVPQDRLTRRLAEALGVDQEILLSDDYELPRGTTTALYKGDYPVTPEQTAEVREMHSQRDRAKMWESFAPRLPAMVQRLKFIEEELKRLEPLQREVAQLRAQIEDFI